MSIYCDGFTRSPLVNFLLGALVAAALLLPGAGLMAQTAISYQGQLQNDGQPASGTVNMEFALYDDATGGIEIDSDGPHSVEVADGLFQVELDFAAGVFDGSERWLEIAVDGAVLSPRQKVTPTPVAVHALTVSGEFWRLGGNVATDPGSDWLGTDDDTALELRVAGARALRLEPSTDSSWGATPNLIGGYPGNLLNDTLEVDGGIVGAVIAGGGHAGSRNIALGDFAVVGGGANNTASAHAAVAGGRSNTANAGAKVGGGEGNNAIGVQSFVGGGLDNTSGGIHAVVAGGSSNSAGGSVAAMGGGEDNTAGGYAATVPGGSLNEAAGDYSLAAGRQAKANHGGAFVWADSVVADFASTGTRQFLIRAGGGMGINTNSPDRGLHVKQRSTTNSEIGLQIERSDSTNNWAFYIATSDNLGFRYNDTLKSRINASDGAFVALSDVNAKHSIEPLSGVLDKVLQLKPRSYRMKDAAATQSRSTGLIAQDVEALFPDTVSVQDGLYGIKYSEITVLNTAALIELHDRYSNRIADLESESAERFAALEIERKRNAELEARVAELEHQAGRNAKLEGRLAVLEALVSQQRQVVGQ